jgi:hydrogenase-4 component E
VIDMQQWIELATVLLFLANLTVLGLSELGSCVRVVAFQGFLLGVFTLIVRADVLTARLIFLGVFSIGMKGFVFPFLLLRGIREAGIRREVEPFVGYVSSIIAGLVMLAVSLWIAARFPIPGPAISTFVIPVALSTVFTGLFLVISRRKAVNQVIGYLVFENGIYMFGIAAVGEIPLLVEFGVLLDVFVAVFVMGIAINHINREFDHIDADQLSSLKG